MRWRCRGVGLEMEHKMITMRALGLAIGIAFAASSFAVAQQGNPAENAAASGGSGTHQSSQKTGSEANTQKVLGNQQGYGRTASRHARSRRHIVAFVPTHRCRMLMREGRPLAKSCRRM
jgi:hypothetical protein